MREVTTLIFWICLSLTSGIAQDFAFENVHVITMQEEDEVLLNQNVLIRGDRILQIGDHGALQIPSNFTIIPGEGSAFLMPGMMDNHGHLPLSTQGIPISLDHYLTLQMVNGVTSIRCCRFEPKALQIRDSLEAQNSLYPRLYLSSPMVAAAFAKLSVFDYTKSSTEIPRFKKEGYDFMKVMSGLNPITHKSMMEICNSIDFPVVGHLPRSVGLDYAIRSRQRDIEHFQGYANINDKQVLDSFIQETAKADIYNCPTIFWYDANYPFLDSIYLRSVDGLQYIPASLRDSWAANHRQSRAAMQGREGAARTNSRKYVLERFAQSNAKLLLSHGDGGYCVPGFGMLEEAKIFQEAGLSNYRILQSACSHPAEFFGEGHSWGKVAEGFLADLILLRQNPLEDIQHLRGIKGVMLEGRWLDEAEIESKLRAILEENERE